MSLTREDLARKVDALFRHEAGDVRALLSTPVVDPEPDSVGWPGGTRRGRFSDGAFCAIGSADLADSSENASMDLAAILTWLPQRPTP